MTFFRNVVGRCGELFIYALIRLFGRRYASGGLLAENAFDPHGNLQAPADWPEWHLVEGPHIMQDVAEGERRAGRRGRPEPVGVGG